MHIATLALVTLALVVGGCAPIYYPNAPYTVLPVEQGEVVGAARAGSAGAEAQILAAPAKNVVVGASGSYLYLPGTSAYVSHRYGELTAGWSDTSGRAFMGVLAGGGLGFTATPPGSRFPWDDVTFDSARYVRLFLQATIGSLEQPRSIAAGRRTNSGFALGVRFAWVRATELWIDDRLQPAASDLFIEPHIAWQSFGESVGTIIDLGVSMNPRGGMRFHHGQLRLGVALVYGLSL